MATQSTLALRLTKYTAREVKFSNDYAREQMAKYGRAIINSHPPRPGRGRSQRQLRKIGRQVGYR